MNGGDPRVDFMVIGAMRSGTTSLADQLGQHPDVCFCRSKEPAYFSSRTNWRESLDQYHALFEPQEGQLLGEGSTSYAAFPESTGTPDRLHAYNPNLKLIYLMRHPVDRVESDYAYRLARGGVTRPAWVEVLRDPTFINRTRYGLQLKLYLRRFKREQVLLLVFEEYVRNPRQGLARVAAFLGLRPEPFDHVTLEPKNESIVQTRVSYKRFMRRKWPAAVSARLSQAVKTPFRELFTVRLAEKPLLPADLREALWLMLEDEVPRVEDLLGRRIEMWSDPSPPPAVPEGSASRRV